MKIAFFTQFVTVCMGVFKLERYFSESARGQIVSKEINCLMFIVHA
jgi:hypothetical protein